MKLKMKPLRSHCLLSSLNLIVFFVGAHIKAEFIDGAPPSERILYDQRQTGNGFNIQISIKDVAIIAMDQNDFEDPSSNGEDYYYDEEDLTVKPLPSWITKPTEGTTSTPVITTVNEINSTNKPDTNITKITPNPIFTNTNATSTIISSISNSTSPYINLLTDQSAQALSNSSKTKSTIFLTKLNVIKEAKNVDKIFLLTKNPSTSNGSVTNYTSVRPQQVTRSKNIITQILKDTTDLYNEPQTQTLNSLPTRNDNNHDKMLKFNIRRAHSKPSVAVYQTIPLPIPYHSSSRQRRCHTDKFVDDTKAACQVRRSSSFLKRLFRLLMSLPQNDSKVHSDVPD